MFKKIKERTRKAFNPDYYYLIDRGFTRRFKLREDVVDHFIEQGVTKTVFIADTPYFELLKDTIISTKSLRVHGLTEIHFRQGDLIVKVEDFDGK